MAKYLVESPHTAEACLEALDEIAKKPVDLAKYDFGCMAGDHTGYAIVEAASESAAKSIVPPVLRKEAKAIKLNKFSLKDIADIHEEIAAATKKK